MKKDIRLKNILKAFIPVFCVGIFMLVFVCANEIIKTIESIEYFQAANFAPLTNSLSELAEVELDEETADLVLDTAIALVDEINEKNGNSVSVCLLDKDIQHERTNNENDSQLPKLVRELSDGTRKLTFQYSYINKEIGRYSFLVRIDHGGLLHLLEENGITRKIIISSAVFAVLTILLFLLLKNQNNVKYYRIAGFIFIVIWIGTLSLSSAFDLSKQSKEIADKESRHITSLISEYYRLDLIEHGDEIEDRRAFAEQYIDVFNVDGGNIAKIELNDNYTETRSDLEGCLDVTADETVRNNRTLEFILGAILFVILAILLYDKLSARLFVAETTKDSNLSKTDRKIMSVELINIIGNCLTWSLMLPRLNEVAKLHSPSNTGSIALIYSAGIILATVTSFLSSRIHRLLGNVKRYFLVVFCGYFVGIMAFALSNLFFLCIAGYFLISLCDGLSSTLIYFYSAGASSDEQKDEFLVSCLSTLGIGESIGIIVGGLLGSTLKYSTVLALGGIIVLISTIMLFNIKKSEFPSASALTVKSDKPKFRFKEVFNKKQTFLFALLIIVPLQFFDVFVNYQFPLDIISFGLTTTVISFVTMTGNLINAYVPTEFYGKMKKRFGLEKMTFVYLIGNVIILTAYFFLPSIIMIIVSTCLMGFLDSFGWLAYNRHLITLAEKEKISEDDGNVVVKASEKAGMSIGPALISLFSTTIVLPITLFCSFIVYKLLGKGKRKNNTDDIEKQNLTSDS